MSKQKAFHKYIYKLHSKRLAEANWELSLPLAAAMENGVDIVELSDSQCLRFIDEFNGIDTFESVKKIKETIGMLRKKEPSSWVNRQLKAQYIKLYETQFQEDYVCIVMDTMKQYDRCNKGFTINGIKYRRLLGTNGGIKANTIIYVSERLYPKLMERIDCGRDKTVPLLPAKLEAYQALVCSGSIPVSMPKGIIVVPDCYTKFTADGIYLDDSETEEPKMTYVPHRDLQVDVSDGFGFMLPELSLRWSMELNQSEEYLSAVNTRGIPWTKGMLFTFDFIDFAETVAHTYMVKDVWGDWRDVREAEVILTESMLKLWKCYESWEDYETKFKQYNYTFAIAKTAPYELEEEHKTNYQFLQSYHLTDEEIDELIAPTINGIEEVMGLDWRKAVLYLNGTHIKPTDIFRKSAGVAEALMIEPDLINDPYVRSMIMDNIRTRIKRAKTGVLDIRGNFAIIGGDLYSLAQSMFGLEITGLLKAGEIYHKFWIDRNVDEVCCFRAPMTSHNNIRKHRVAHTPDMEYWYRYVTTCVLFNSWDTTAEALNGCDMDGDLSYTTDNRVLLNRFRLLPTVFCVQRTSPKKIVNETDIIESNKLSFGDAIGATTNIITSQICLQAKFDPSTPEFRELDYRILCGQLYQQGCIDKAKGIEVKPMPKHWKSRKKLIPLEGDSKEDIERKEFLNRIAADRKPYFFIYIYDDLYSRYRKYMKNAEANCIRNFGIGLQELIHSKQQTDQEKEFLGYYYKYLPVDETPCTINRICWRISDRVEAFSQQQKTNQLFNVLLLKTPNPQYTNDQYYYVYNLLKEEYELYRKGMQELNIQMQDNFIHGAERALIIEQYKKLFIKKVDVICPDEQLRCDVLIDIAYKSNVSKAFVWVICGKQIIRNLLLRNGNRVFYPKRTDIVACEQADFFYRGERFTMHEKVFEDSLKTERDIMEDYESGI